MSFRSTWQTKPYSKVSFCINMSSFIVCQAIHFMPLAKTVSLVLREQHIIPHLGRKKLCQKESMGLILTSHLFYIAVFLLLLAEQPLICASFSKIRTKSSVSNVGFMYLCIICTEMKTHTIELLQYQACCFGQIRGVYN